jgi:acyl-CoA reductase-like NAD-dependent aldehyde dehydrogenase
MQHVVIGHSDDPRTQLGPLAMKRQLERVEMYVEDGRRTADLVTGGRRPPHPPRGYFIEPTLFANVEEPQPHCAGRDLRPGAEPDPGRR